MVYYSHAMPLKKVFKDIRFSNEILVKRIIPFIDLIVLLLSIFNMVRDSIINIKTKIK